MDRDGGFDACCSTANDRDTWMSESAYGTKALFNREEVFPGFERVDMFAAFKSEEVRFCSLCEHNRVVLDGVRIRGLNGGATLCVINGGDRSADKGIAAALSEGRVWGTKVCFAARAGERIDQARGEEGAFVWVDKGDLDMLGEFLGDGEAGKPTTNNEDA